jgi:hypothetical protein
MTGRHKRPPLTHPVERLLQQLEAGRIEGVGRLRRRELFPRRQRGVAEIVVGA